ncbi:hypothetical protein [Streptomyces enissocaesilis]|uniref:hypothetical protein n=1 Tax=Streptomyces enissocaesilis TaxID=332589 RepID=UPI0031DF74AB
MLDERARTTAKVAELQAAGQRLDALIALAAHPDSDSCPATLDQAVTRSPAP